MIDRALVAFLAALVTTGSIHLATLPASGLQEPDEAEARMGPLAPGSLAGTNGTNASVSLAGSLDLLATNVLHLNNTNASGPYYARLVLREATGVSNLATLDVGIDNGTRTSQITASTGTLTGTGGAYVRLEPGSANRIYADHALALLGSTSVLRLDVYVADDAGESAFYTMRAQLTIG